ncbi:MAG: CDP-alcohol phosphatidyltransferase family protein [Ruminiclostridium sp.]|nr:CDP-alcohol phosphatidyltransferase family protein [Ruminiclostridium sp.]
MLGYYNYTVLLTYAGMLTSLGGILFASSGSMTKALLCLMISGFCDMFDGRVASTMERTKKEKSFGIQIDSLSDLICFGVFPAAIVHALAPNSMVTSCVCGLYVLCALIRLAYFNVEEAERQSQTDTPREAYLGLPVTTAALILPLVVLLSGIIHVSAATILPGVLLVMAVAFITPFRLRKPKLRGKLLMLLGGAVVLVLLLVRGAIR